MKKILASCLVLLISMNLGVSTLAAVSTENAFSLDAIFNENLKDGILHLTENDMDEFNNIIISSPETIDNFLNTDGIIVVSGDESSEPAVLDEQLGVSFHEVDSMNARSVVTNDADSGIDIATIYYKHSGVFAVHEINIGTNDTTDREALIEEVLNEVRNDQLQPQVAASGTGSLIGERNYTYTREPKGKMTAYYDAYTVQDLNSQDYYMIKAVVTGMPGSDLGGSYETKYQGENMKVTLSSSSTSVTRDSYGPERTIGSSSYSVNIGATFGKEISGDLGLSWTKTISDTDIDVSLSSPGATWTANLTGEAQKYGFSFEPGISMACPSNKSSISVTANASYTLDSWDTLEETISLNKSFTCTPTSVN